MNIDAIEESLLSLISGEFSSLSVEYNYHAYNYTSVKAAIEQGDYTNGTWVSSTERIAAVLKNSAWTVNWYPRSPVVNCTVYASTLKACLEYALEVQKNDKA